MLVLKQLLHEFHLVHARGASMKHDSDLIVPAYWRSRESALWLFLGDLLKNDPTLVNTKPDFYVQWEYHFATALPDVIFDELVIESHWQEHERQVGPDWIRYVVDDQFACRIVMSRADHTLERVLRLEAIASESATTAMWGRFEHLCESLERVLGRYNGLVVSRFVEDNKRTQHELDDLVDKRMQMPPSRLERKPWLPPSLDWYDAMRMARVRSSKAPTVVEAESDAVAFSNAEIKWAEHLSIVKGVFPDVETTIAIHLLESHGGDLNEVIGQLMGEGNEES